VLLNKGLNVNVRINIDISNVYNLPRFYEFVCSKKWFDYKNFSVKPSVVKDHSTLEYKDPIVPEELLLEKLIQIYDKYPELEEQFGLYMFKPLRHILDILNGAPNVAPRFYNCESNLIELNIFCPDGYIYTCPESIGHKEHAIGRFYPDLLFYEDKIKNWKMRNILEMEDCRKCTYGPICGGGCAYSSILIQGNYNKPVCEQYKQVLDTFFRLRGEKILNKFTG
ncbi:MAG: SPASM domain-containing protein, partial [Candidatus Humimicrobiaceae bacterium]